MIFVIEKNMINEIVDYDGQKYIKLNNQMSLIYRLNHNH